MLKSITTLAFILLSIQAWAGATQSGRRLSIQPATFAVGDAFKISFQDLKKNEFEHRSQKARPNNGNMTTVSSILETKDEAVTKVLVSWNEAGSDADVLANMLTSLTAFNEAYGQQDGSFEDLVKASEIPVHVLEKKDGTWAGIAGSEVDPEQREWIVARTADQFDGISTHAHYETPSQNLLADIQVLAVEAGKPTRVSVTHQGAQITSIDGVVVMVTPGQPAIFTKKAAGWVALEREQAAAFPNGMIGEQLDRFFEDESFVLGLLPMTGETPSWPLSEKATAAVLERVIGDRPTDPTQTQLRAEWIQAETGLGLHIHGQYQFTGDNLDGMPYTTVETLNWTYEFQPAPFRLVRQRLSREQAFHSTPGACDCTDPQLAALFQDGIYHIVSGQGIHTLHLGMVGGSVSKPPLFDAGTALTEAFSNVVQQIETPSMSHVWKAYASEGMTGPAEVGRQLAAPEVQQQTMNGVWSRVLMTEAYPEVYAWLQQDVIKEVHAKLVQGIRNDETAIQEMTALAAAIKNDETLGQNLSSWGKNLRDHYWYQDLIIEGRLYLLEAYLQYATESGRPVDAASLCAEAKDALREATKNYLLAFGMYLVYNKNEAERDDLTQKLFGPEAMVWLHLQQFVGRMTAMEIASAAATAPISPAP